MDPSTLPNMSPYVIRPAKVKSLKGALVYSPGSWEIPLRNQPGVKLAKTTPMYGGLPYIQQLGFFTVTLRSDHL